MTWVFCLNDLSCIYYGHTALVIEVWSHLFIEEQAAECKSHICNHLAIIMQSEPQSSSGSSFKVWMLKKRDDSETMATVDVATESKVVALC